MKNKSRMKDWIVTVAYSHESYNGNDHSDGEEDFEVKAMNEDAAERKALVLANKKNSGYNINVTDIRLKHEE